MKGKKHFMEKGLLVIAFLVIAILVLSFSIAYAKKCEKFVAGQCAELEWEKADARSGEVAEIVISPSNPDIVYAGFEVNVHSLYKSTDGGKTWRRIEGGDHTKDVAVSPKDPNKAYFAMSESLFTTDKNARGISGSQAGGSGGETKALLLSGYSPGPAEQSFSSVEVFEKDDKIIYASVKGGGFGPFGETKPKIFKTTNGGNSWTEVMPDLEDVNVVEIHPTNHNLIYIGSKDGIYASKDSGKTLEKLKSAMALGGFISIEMQKDDPNVIYIASSSEALKTDDGGKNWEDITGQLDDIHRVRVSMSNPNILYASTFNGVFRSDDFGETWTDKTSNLKEKNIQIVTIHPENPDIAFIGHSSLWSAVRAELRYKQALWAHQGIFKTTDGGNSWFRADDGIFEYDLEEVATSPHRANEAWFAAPASRGGYKTIDAGHNWRHTQIQTLHYPMRIKYSMQDPDKIYITSWHSGGPFGLSEDGGASWKLTNEQEYFDGLNRGKHLYDRNQRGHIHVHGLAVDPNDGSIVYSGSVREDVRHGGGEFPLEGAHIFKSTDAGKTWIESDEGFPHEKHTAIHDIQIDSKNTNVIYATTTKHEATVGVGIYKSTDSGKTWKAINKGLGSLSVATIAIHPENTELLLAATEGGLYKSENGGNSWKKTSSSHSFDVEYVKENPEIVYASTNDGVLKSRDFGDTWYGVNFGLPKGDGQGIGVSVDGNVIYSAVKEKGVYVARLEEVEPIEPVSIITGKGFGFGMMPDFFGEEKGKDKRGFEIPEKPDYAEGIPIEDISADMLESECDKYPWPPSCSFIPDEEGQKFCRVCKGYKENPEKYLEKEKVGDIADEEELLAKKEVKIKEPEITEAEEEKEPNIFVRIMTFFRNLFGGSEEETEIKEIKKPKEEKREKSEIESGKQDKLPQISQKEEENLLSQISEECGKTPKIPSFGYQGLLTEVHVHTSTQDNPGTFAMKLLGEMNENGVDRIVIQPNHDPSGNKENSRDIEEIWGVINAVCPRIIPLVYAFNPDKSDSWKYVEELLDTGNYGGVGEIEFQHGGLNIEHDPESSSMLRVYDMLEEKGLALHFQANLERAPYLEDKMFKIIKNRPKINFIWFGCPFNDKFMSLPNLYCDSFFHSESYDPEEKYLGKNLLATDSSAAGFFNPAYSFLPYSNFGEALAEARKKFTELPKKTADIVTHKNFNKIWPKGMFAAKRVDEIDSFDDYEDLNGFGGSPEKQGTSIQDFPGGEGPGFIPDECPDVPWPPDCSFIPDATGSEMCKKCR